MNLKTWIFVVLRDCYPKLSGPFFPHGQTWGADGAAGPPYITGLASD